MPNQVHQLWKPLGEHSLVDILHSWKSFTANVLNRKMNRGGALWMHESFDTIVRDAGHLRVCRDYVAQNPKKAHLAPDEFVLERRDVLLIDGEFGSQAACLTRPSDCQPDVVLREQDARRPSEAASFTSETAPANRALQRKHLLRAKKFGFSDRQL